MMHRFRGECRGRGFAAFATRAPREIITVLWGVAGVSIVKRRGFKQFMAEEYLFSEVHAGFHTWSSVKYSLNWRPGELQRFTAVMCGPANLTCHVECLTSACCGCETSIWKIDRLQQQARSIWALQPFRTREETRPVCFFVKLGTLLGKMFNCSSSCVLW